MESTAESGARHRTLHPTLDGRFTNFVIEAVNHKARQLALLVSLFCQ